MTARRFFTAVGVVFVAAVAGAISYRHQSELALHNGQPALLAAVWPACVDGLVMSCGIAIATDRAGGFRPRLWALVGFWLGVTVSVMTNWLATSGGPIAHAVSAFPAVAFLIAVESLSAKPRALKTVTEAATPTAVEVVEPVPVVEVERRAVPTKPRKVPTAAARVAEAARKMPDATNAQIAAKVGVSESTVRRHLAAVAPVSTPPAADADAFTTAPFDVFAGATAAPRPAAVNGHDRLAEVSA